MSARKEKQLLLHSYNCMQRFIYLQRGRFRKKTPIFCFIGECGKESVNQGQQEGMSYHKLSSTLMESAHPLKNDY